MAENRGDTVTARIPISTLWSAPHWRGRLLTWAGAATVGVAAVAFAKIADLAQWGLRRMLAWSPAVPWILAPVGFFAIAWLTRRYFRGAEGSGIPQTIFAQRPDSGDKGRLFLAPRVVVGGVLLAACGLLRCACCRGPPDGRRPYPAGAARTAPLRPRRPGGPRAARPPPYLPVFAVWGS